MVAGVVIIAALAGLLVVGRITRHRHATVTANLHAVGVDHVASWERCTCGAMRMCGDRRWHRRPFNE